MIRSPSGPPSDTPSGPPPGPPGREEVVAILARFGDRAPEAVIEPIGSLELAWLISEVERRYGVLLDLSDEVMERMATVSGAVTALGSLLAGVADGSGG